MCRKQVHTDSSPFSPFHLFFYFFFIPQAFNKNNLILEERNKYFNPQLAGKTYTNAYFTDLNTYDDY